MATTALTIIVGFQFKVFRVLCSSSVVNQSKQFCKLLLLIKFTTAKLNAIFTLRKVCIICLFCHFSEYGALLRLDFSSKKIFSQQLPEFEENHDEKYIYIYICLMQLLMETNTQRI